MTEGTDQPERCTCTGTNAGLNACTACPTPWPDIPGAGRIRPQEPADAPRGPVQAADGPAEPWHAHDGAEAAQGGPGVELLPYPQHAPNACRTTRHCADHGWCHRCDPDFAAVMDRVNAAIQHADSDSRHWGPLYEAVGKALRGEFSLDSPEGMLASRPGSGRPKDATVELDDGPSVAECAKADDEHWNTKYAGEGS